METTAKQELPAITLSPVESSQLAAIGHCPTTNRLAIQFKGKGEQPGSVYHYSNFTADDFLKFQESESKGSHFKKLIKPAVIKHPYSRIS